MLEAKDDAVGREGDARRHDQSASEGPCGRIEGITHWGSPDVATLAPHR